MTPIKATGPGVLSSALAGIKRAEAQAVQAANQLANVGRAPATPTTAGATVNDMAALSERAAVVPDVAAENARAAAVLADVDTGMAGPIVDLLQAKTAYAANAATVRVSADLEREVVGLIGDRK